jgi:hypothetical protein
LQVPKDFLKKLVCMLTPTKYRKEVLYFREKNGWGRRPEERAKKYGV